VNERNERAHLERYVTISVDDGHPTDLKTARLLHKYGLQATFYIPACNPERAVMSADQIAELGAQFEIGGHTFHHTPLKTLRQEKAWAEINDGKRWLEDVLGQPVVSFCYPRGKFNATTIALVREAGFLGARTCLFNLNGFPRDPFCWGVSTHACDHSRSIQVRHAFLEGNFSGVWNFLRHYKAATNWQVHFRHALDYVGKYGGIAHLYLHSWEIEEGGQWQSLESTFDLIAQYKLCAVTNGTLFRQWSVRQNHGRSD
jgi:peptidoglycan-N-acetylglucosamine deacetylase